MLFIVMTCVSGSPKVGNKKDDSSQSATSDPNSSSESGNQAVDSSARS